MTDIPDDLRLAIEDIAAGKPILLSDSPDREDEADVVLAAELVDRRNLLEMYQIAGAGGLFCVPMLPERLETLALEPQTYNRLTIDDITPRDPCKFYTPVDAKQSRTGVSVTDRVAAIDALVHDTAPIYHRDSQLIPSGHTFPLCAAKGGLYERQGHTEGSLALVELAGCDHRIAVITEVMDPETGFPMQGQGLEQLAVKHGLRRTSIEAISTYLQST